MKKDASKLIRLRMAWCRSARARTESELDGWRAEEAGLRDAILKQDQADHYRLSTPEIFDRYVLGFRDGTALLSAARVERQDSYSCRQDGTPFAPDLTGSIAES
jgi:hypothetical protein